jgi:hypothetical protein
MCFDILKDLLTQVVFLKQVEDPEDSGLIVNPNPDQIDAGNAAHCGHLDESSLHSLIAPLLPLLHHMYSQPLLYRSLRLRVHWVPRPAAFYLVWP